LPFAGRSIRAEMKQRKSVAMLRTRVSGRTVIATVIAEMLVIFLAAYWYAGTPGWRHGDEGPPITVHLQFGPHPAPLARTFST
jgi:hypothetical protein